MDTVLEKIKKNTDAEHHDYQIDDLTANIPVKGKAVVIGLIREEYLLRKSVNGKNIDFKASAASDIFISLENGDEVLYEIIEDSIFILNILSFSKNRRMCEFVLPMDAGIRSCGNLALAADSVSCKAQIVNTIAQHISSSSQNYSLKAERADINAKLLEENIQTNVQYMNIQKSEISGIYDAHHANSNIKVDKTYSLAADFVKLDANGHVDIDGKKINLG
jgi:hypothetical protein